MQEVLSEEETNWSTASIADPKKVPKRPCKSTLPTTSSAYSLIFRPRQSHSHTKDSRKFRQRCLEWYGMGTLCFVKLGMRPASPSVCARSIIRWFEWVANSLWTLCVNEMSDSSCSRNQIQNYSKMSRYASRTVILL